MSPALAHPSWALPLLGLWLLLAALALLSSLRSRRLLRAVVHGADASGGDALRVLALACCFAALLGFELGTRELQVPASGVDVVLLVDVSRSMDARDVAPSRLLRARQVAEQVLARLRAGDRAALAVFAGEGVVLTPLTHDLAALGEMLPALDSSLLSDTSSRLREGVRAAQSAFRESGDRPKLLLVLSDGERAHVAAPAHADAARAAGVRVVAVAFGSEGGASIPALGGAQRDSNGQPVITRRETAGLERYTRATDGALFLADDWGAVDIPALTSALERDAPSTREGFVTRRVPLRHHALPAALGCALICFGLWRESWRRRLPSAAAAAALASLLAGAAEAPELAGLAEAVRRNPHDADALVALGIARARGGARAEAEHAFLAAAVRAQDAGTAALAYFDLGVSALEAGELARAQAAFFDALALAPREPAARFNLEWTLAALAREASASGQEPPDAQRKPPSLGNDEEEAGDDEDANAAADEPAEAGEEKADPRAAQPSDVRAARALGDEEAERWLGLVQDDAASGMRREAKRGARANRGEPDW